MALIARTASSRRTGLVASAVLAAVLLVSGCATAPGSSTSSAPDPAPTSSPGPDQSPGTVGPHAPDDMEAVWLDDGRKFTVVTWGSSGCIPTVAEVSANGQQVSVELTEGDDAEVCTADLGPRASLGALPEGVDPTQDVELIVTLGDVTDDVELDGNAAFTPSAQGTEPSAGWFDEDGIVLLTWGSSTCGPIIEDVQPNSSGATVTFATDDRVCTDDLAPRATIIFVGDDDDTDGDDDGDDDADDDDAFTLTLVGGGLDATVPVHEG